MQFIPSRWPVSIALAAAIAGLSAIVSAQEFAGRDKLRAHSSEFRKDVIKVTDGVYVAVGYSLGNAILVLGDGGSIIIDTTSTPADARDVKAEFAKISTAPVRAIVYTHFHADHVGGASVFAGTDAPEIFSHQLLVERAADIGRAGRDGGNQFGSALPDSLFINAGIGPSVGRRAASGTAPGTNPPAAGSGYLQPTRTFAGDRMTVTIAGVRLELLHTPGETNDAISVWLPDRKLLMPGDDFYRAFPNLYAIRGVRLRPVDQWVTSLGRMIELGAEHIVPSHTRPISGASDVRSALTTYRDGIKSVLDQTLEGMRRGERPDELVQHVQLPPALAASPYLQEFYGTVAWSVRAIYTDYLGWFDGNATNLFPLPQQERASKIVALAGGSDRVLTNAREALTAGQFQWAAELADYLLALDSASMDARRVKAQALTELGERQISANARNYYLSSAQYLLREQSAVAQASPAAAAQASPDVRGQVLAAERAFAKSMADRSLDAFARFVADDAVFFSDPEPRRGKTQVVEWWSRFFTAGTPAPFSWDPDQVELLSSGALAWSTGPVRDRQGRVVSRFNSIWRRDADGSWRIVFDKGDSGPPQ